MNRHIIAVTAFALIAASVSACDTLMPPNDAPTRSNDPRGVSDTAQRQSASASYSDEVCRQNKRC